MPSRPWSTPASEALLQCLNLSTVMMLRRVFMLIISVLVAKLKTAEVIQFPLDDK